MIQLMAEQSGQNYDQAQDCVSVYAANRTVRTDVFFFGRFGSWYCRFKIVLFG